MNSWNDFVEVKRHMHTKPAFLQIEALVCAVTAEWMQCRAVYELTAVVAHVVDASEDPEEGHLVAHVKVNSIPTG